MAMVQGVRDRRAGRVDIEADDFGNREPFIVEQQGAEHAIPGTEHPDRPLGLRIGLHQRLDQPLLRGDLLVIAGDREVGRRALAVKPRDIGDDAMARERRHAAQQVVKGLLGRFGRHVSVVTRKSRRTIGMRARKKPAARARISLFRLSRPAPAPPPPVSSPRSRPPRAPARPRPRACGGRFPARWRSHRRSAASPAP